MIEVYFEPGQCYYGEPYGLLYRKQDLFVWSHVIDSNKWEPLQKFPAVLDLRVIKLFEIEDEGS